MSTEHKIRVALIGLNAPHVGTPTGTSWAASAHLPYLRTSSKFELVALQNSTRERAEQAIAAHKLDSTKVKAYGSPEDVAHDPNIDLVVSSIRVDRHGNSVIPSINAGKAVFVEWPLEANYQLAKNLTELVKQHNVRNVVGLQGSFPPVIRKLKTMIERGDIGKVESSTAIIKLYGGPTMPAHIDYFTEKKVGGNHFTICFGHSMECFQTVLGNVARHQSLLVNQYPTVDITDPATRAVIEHTRPSDVPNQIALTAVLDSGAVLTFKIHNSATISPHASPASDKGQLPALDWRIFGTKGEIRLTTYGSWAVQVGAPEMKVELWTADTGELVEVGIEEEEDGWGELPAPARNVARLYEAFAEGKWYPDFEHALKRHEMIERMFRANGF